MTEQRKCGECGRVIVEGYIDIKVAPTLLTGPARIVRLHSFAGCVEKFKVKHPLPGRSLDE
jgi:hypothetical protein